MSTGLSLSLALKQLEQAIFAVLSLANNYLLTTQRLKEPQFT